MALKLLTIFFIIVCFGIEPSDASMKFSQVKGKSRRHISVSDTFSLVTPTRPSKSLLLEKLEVEGNRDMLEWHKFEVKVKTRRHLSVSNSFSLVTPARPPSKSLLLEKMETGENWDMHKWHKVELVKSRANIVVAKDGTGNYQTVNEAVAASPNNSVTRFVIHIKRGVYNETVHIGQQKTNITFLGDGKDLTILTGSLNDKDGTKTFNSATLAVDGNGFLARDMCIQNTAGASKGAAVALRVSGDRSILYRCRIDGYQDTLYAHSNNQFYRECYITGTVDFICGHASAVFQYCKIVARKPLAGQGNMITAHNREQNLKVTGFSFQRCNITASRDLIPVKGFVKTFLGRPWGSYSTVIFMQSFLDNLIDPAGWAPWDNNKTTLSTLFYGEYDNNGPGANTFKRVHWKGFKILKNPTEASKFTVAKFIDGNSWIRSTGVPYEEGL